MSVRYVGAFWGARAETAVDSAARLARCLEGFDRVHDSLTDWARQARTRRSASKPVELSVEALAEMVARNSQRDDGGNRIPDLGSAPTGYRRRWSRGARAGALRRPPTGPAERPRLRPPGVRRTRA